MAIEYNDSPMSVITFNDEILDEVYFNDRAVYEKLPITFFFTGKHDAIYSNYPLYVYSDTLSQQSIYGANETFTFWIPRGDRVTLDFSKYKQYYTSQLPYGSDLDDNLIFGVDIAGLSQNYRIIYDPNAYNPSSLPNYNKTKITFTMDKAIYVYPYEFEYGMIDLGCMGDLYTRTSGSKRSTYAIFEAKVLDNAFEVVASPINLTDVVYS